MPFIFVVLPKVGVSYSAARIAISGTQPPAWASQMRQFRLVLEPGEWGLAHVAADAAAAVYDVGEEVAAVEPAAGSSGTAAWHKRTRRPGGGEANS